MTWFNVRQGFLYDGFCMIVFCKQYLLLMCTRYILLLRLLFPLDVCTTGDIRRIITYGKLMFGFAAPIILYY